LVFTPEGLEASFSGKVVTMLPEGGGENRQRGAMNFNGLW